MVPLQVDQQAAVGTPTAEGKVVHAEKTGSRQRREAMRAQVRQHGIPAASHTQVAEQASSRLTSRSKGQVHQPCAQAIHAARMRTGDSWAPFGEDAAGAVRLITKE